MSKRLTIFLANIEEISRPPLLPILRQHRPDVVLLQQAAAAEHFLTTFPLYKVLSSFKNGEARAIKMMVSSTVKVQRVRFLLTFLAWTGPKAGRRHLGRTFMALKIIEPFPCWVVDVHFPTGGPHGPNSEAWLEAWNKVAAFSKRRTPIVLAGDFNATPAELSLKAEQAGFDRVTIGKVDHALSKGLKHRYTDRNLPGTPDSVHGWGTVTYELEENR